MARIPGIYVSIQGDVTQLNADLGKARKMVKEAADDISNALGNALKPQQITSGLSSLITKINELSSHSKLLTTSFDGLSAELGDLSRLTGMASGEFAKLQSKFLEAEAVRTAERALTSMGRTLELNAQEVMNLGVKFNLAEASIRKVSSALGLAETASMSLANVQKRVSDSAVAVEAAERRIAAASKEVAGSLDRLPQQIDAAFAKMDLPVAKVEADLAKMAAASYAAADAMRNAFHQGGQHTAVISSNDVKNSMGSLASDMEAAFAKIPVVVNTATASIDSAFAKGVAGISSGARKYAEATTNALNSFYKADQHTAVISSNDVFNSMFDGIHKVEQAFPSLEATAKQALLKSGESAGTFQHAVATAMAAVEERLQRVALSYNLTKEQVAQFRADAQKQIELKIRTDDLKQVAKDAGYAKQKVAELEQQFNVKLSEGSGLLGGKDVSGVIKNTFLYGGAYQLLGWAQQLPTELIKINAAMQALQASFSGIFGANATSQFEYITSAASKYGKSVDSVADSYRKFAAATEYVGVSNAQTKDIFESVTQAISKIGGSSEDVKGSLLALQQALSKGTLSSEEFRLQFAERIPGAMKMGADALGVTETKFKSLLESGQIVTSEFIPKLAAQLNVFSQGWEKSSDTLVTNWERFKNALEETAYSERVTSGLSSVVKAMTAVIEKVKEYNEIKLNQSKAGALVDKGLLDSQVLFYDPERLKKTLAEYDSATSAVDDRIAYIQSRLKAENTESQNWLVEQYDKIRNLVSSQGKSTDSPLQIELQTAEAQKNVETLMATLKDLAATRDRNAKTGFFDPSVDSQLVSVIDKLKQVQSYDGKTVRMLIDVDTTPLQSALNLIQRLAGASAQAKVDAAQGVFDRVQQEYNVIKNGVTEAVKGAGEVRSTVASAVSEETRNRLKDAEAALVQAKKDLDEKKKQLADDQYKQTDAYKDYNATYNGVNVSKLPKYGDISQADAALKKFKSEWEELNYKFQEGGINEKGLWAGRTARLKEYQGTLEDIAKKQNKGANAAAHHAVAVEKLNDTLDNYLAKQMGLASDDTLGAKFADIAAKADNLRAKARDLAIAGGVDLATAFKKIDDAVTAARDAAGDDLIEKLFPWVKKENSLQTGFEALYKHYGDLSAAAKRAGMSMDDVKKLLNDKQVFVNYTTQLKAIKDKLDTTFNFAEYKANFDKLSDLQYQDNGSKEKESWEELLKTYDEVTGKMYRLKADMYDRITEKARAAGMEEAQVQAILQAQMEEMARQSLENVVKYSTSFSDTLAAKWSLAFGGYKSAASKARDDWDQMSDSIISSTNGMIDGIAGGFGDLIRNIGNGTASIEDLWKNMLARMLDAFASFVESIIKQKLKDLVGGLFSGSDSQTPSGAASSLLGGNGGSGNGLSSVSSLWKGFGKDAGEGLGDYFSSATSSGTTFYAGSSDAMAKMFGDGIDMSKLGTSELWNTSSTAVSAATMASTYSTAETAAMSAGSLLSTVGSVLGVVGGVAGVVGLVAGLFGEQNKKEVKKVASGYNVQYASGKTVTSGVDFYSDNSVVSTGAGDPDVTKKISDAFRNAAEQLSDFADVLGFTVDILQGFKMPAMNITDSQLDTYIRNGTNTEAFQALEQAGLRGAFDKLAQDGEVYIDEVERLSTAYSTGSAKLSAYGYQMADVAQVTQGQIDELRQQTVETAAGTSQAIMAMAQSMGATSDQLAELAANASDGSQALAVTDEQLSNLLEADWVSKVEDAVGGEDAFNGIMDNLLKNVFDSIDAYAANLGYYRTMADKYISRLGDDTITVENFWNKFNEALKNGLDPDQFEAWSKASTWVNSIDTVNDAVDQWNEGMRQLNQSLDVRMLKAQGLTYQAQITEQLASAEKELYEARQAGYNAAYLAKLQEVQAAEMAALVAQHQEDYQKAVRDASKRYAEATDDSAALIAIQMEENAAELQALAKTYNWSPGSSEEALFQAVQAAQAAEILAKIQQVGISLQKATESMKANLAARQAAIAGYDKEAEAIQKVKAYQDELNQAYQDGLDQSLIDELMKTQLDELAKYWSDTIDDMKSNLNDLYATQQELLGTLSGNTQTAVQNLQNLFIRYQAGETDLADSIISSLQSIASAVKSMVDNINDTLADIRTGADTSTTTADVNAATAKSYFASQVSAAASGDTTAMSNVTSYATKYLDALKASTADASVYKSGVDYVTAALSNLSKGATGTTSGLSDIATQVTNDQIAEAQLALKKAEVAQLKTTYDTLMAQSVEAFKASGYGNLVQQMADTGTGWKLGIEFLNLDDNWDGAHTGARAADRLIQYPNETSTFLQYFLSRYGAGSGYVDWNSAFSYWVSTAASSYPGLPTLPDSVNSIYSQAQTAYQQWQALKTQYGFSSGGVIAGGTLSGDNTLSFTNKRERVLTERQNVAFERLAFADSGGSPLVAEVKALRAEVKELRRANTEENRAINSKVAKVYDMLDDWNINGQPAERVQ